MVVVDDDEDMRVLIGSMLRIRLGIDVLDEGANGDDAIALAEAHRPDILILDHVMPVLRGADAIPGIRAASPDTCIVMYSATMLRAVDLGDESRLPDNFVSKSAGLEGLLDAVRQCVESKELRS